jgi:hypothetical protein
MDVLLGGIQSESSFVMELFYFSKSLENPLRLLPGEDVLTTKHEDMSPASPEVVRDQPFITRRRSFDIPTGKKIDDFLRGEDLKSGPPQFFDLHPFVLRLKIKFGDRTSADSPIFEN